MLGRPLTFNGGAKIIALERHVERHLLIALLLLSIPKN
jgi:hypothetical protein